MAPSPEHEPEGAGSEAGFDQVVRIRCPHGIVSAGRCHICGGNVEGERWEADQVFVHSAGGAHAAALSAHTQPLYHYQWDYSAEEFQ